MATNRGQMPVFSDDIVPDYLRNKPDPEAEQRTLLAKEQPNIKLLSLVPSESAIKLVAQYEVVTHVLDMVSKAKEEWEFVSSSRSGVQQTSSMTDTQVLVAAVGMGQALKDSMPVPVLGSAPGGGMMVSPAIRPPVPVSSVSPFGVNQLGKAPAAIKTNIKLDNQIHSFGRYRHILVLIYL